jgi:hypothetical protein
MDEGDEEKQKPMTRKPVGSIEGTGRSGDTRALSCAAATGMFPFASNVSKSFFRAGFSRSRTFPTVRSTSDRDFERPFPRHRAVSFHPIEYCLCCRPGRRPIAKLAHTKRSHREENPL